jgi:hypothetical protein
MIKFVKDVSKSEVRLTNSGVLDSLKKASDYIRFNIKTQVPISCCLQWKAESYIGQALNQTGEPKLA